MANLCHWAKLCSPELSPPCTKKLKKIRLSLACLLPFSIQALEQYMSVKYTTVKRYGGEGAESMLAFFHQLLTQAAHCEY